MGKLIFGDCNLMKFQPSPPTNLWEVPLWVRGRDHWHFRLWRLETANKPRGNQRRGQLPTSPLAHQQDCTRGSGRKLSLVPNQLAIILLTQPGYLSNTTTDFLTPDFKWHGWLKNFFWGVKFSIPGFFGVGKFGKYFPWVAWSNNSLQI